MGIPNELDPWLGPYGEAVPRRAAAPELHVYRILDDGFRQWMPNVVLLRLDEYLGAQYPVAVMRYRFSANADPNLFPTYSEQVVNTLFSGPYILNEDDRLRVVATRPDGAQEAIFEGFVRGVSQAQDAHSDSVILTCPHVASQAWQYQIDHAWIKHRDEYPDTEKPPIPLYGPAYFNPRGEGNRCADEERIPFQTALGEEILMPIFRDPDPTGATQFEHWTTDAAVLYLAYTWNPTEEFVRNPTKDEIDDALIHAVNTSPPGTIPALIKWHYEKTRCEYTPLYGKYWIPLIEQLCANKHALIAIRTEGTPEDAYGKLEIWRPDAAYPKWLFLQERGSDLDRVLSNVNAAHVTRDLSGVANIVIVRGAPRLVECSLILAPAFASEATDGDTIPARRQWRKANLTPENAHKYRTWIFDEAGDGHYLPAANTLIETPGDLDDILGAPEDDVPRYVRRRRRPRGRLFSWASADVRHAFLSISKDYEGDIPAVWRADGPTPGTWQRVDHGWELLEDRIGITLTVEDPNEWHISRVTDPTMPYRSGVVRAVESYALNNARHPWFSLRLTCVIEADERVRGAAEHRGTSPLRRPVARLVDADDRYEHHMIAPHSEFADPAETEFVNVRDDRDAAQAEAEAVLLALRAGDFNGQITLKRFTRFYRPGDRIAGVWGRGTSFATSPDDPPPNEYPGIPQPDPIPAIADFPYVVAVTHVFEPRLETILTLAGFNDTFRK